MIPASMEEAHQLESRSDDLSQRRSYWRWRKQDFFPEFSFQSFSTYKSALSATCPRLADRLLSRSSDAYELDAARRESENPMRRCLTWWDLLWLSFGSVVGSGVFVITGQEARVGAGPAVVLSYAISGVSALLSVLCYAEFGVEIPVAGGSFSYLRVELGDFIAFIAAGNILLEAMVGAAGLGRSWSSYLASLVKNDSDYFRIKVDSFAKGFDLLDPVAVAVLLVANGIAMTGTKRTSWLNLITSMVTVCIIVFIVVVGFTHSKTSNLVPFFPYGAKGVVQSAAVVYWSYTGFDMVANMAEETEKPSRDIPIGLVGSMSMITVVYCLMALALTMMVKYTEIDANAAYSVAFAQIGMKWAKYLVGICALKGMTTSLLVGSLGQARYTTQIARSHMIPPWFALVHPKTGTPIYATLLVTILSSIISFFTSLEVLSSVFSFATLFIFMLVAVALLVLKSKAPAVKWIKEWVPQDIVATGGKCHLHKWVTEDTFSRLKEKEKEPDVPEPEPEPTTEILFLCSYDGCGKTFFDVSALRKHSHIHGERQYVCDQEGCGKKFLDSSKLKRHYLIHTGERNYICTYEGCGKAFSLDFNLRSHMKTHSQENYHICPYSGCVKRYAHEYKLKNHVAAYHEKNGGGETPKYTPPAEKVLRTVKTPATVCGPSSDRPYACPYEGCEKAYIHEYKLKLHLKREHPGHLQEENADTPTLNKHNGNDRNEIDDGSDQDVYRKHASNGKGQTHKQQSRAKPNMRTPPAKVGKKGSTSSPAKARIAKKPWQAKETFEEVEREEEEDSEETEEDRDNVEDGWRFGENNEDDDDDEETEYED